MAGAMTISASMSFELHPLLAQECLPIAELGICNLYLRNVKHFPWLLLVPAQPNLREIFDLSANDYTTAMQEVRRVTEIFADITKADKMNVATLGNVCPQLHIHIIARYKTDAAWPQPVWNVSLPATPYESAQALIQRIQAAL
jgi:diadenosine tetraphosphate (Ap4A) HIT family hydrolase